MKICYLADAGSIHIQRWIGFFVEKDYEIHLISFRKGEIEGVSLHYLRPLIPFSFNLSYILSIPTIRMMVKEIKPDLLHAYYATSYGFIGACCNFTPFLVSCIGSDVMINLQRSAPYRWITNLALKEATFVTSVSRPITDRIIEQGIPVERIQTIPLGVDHEKFFPSSQDQKEFLSLSTRSLEPIYNIETILKGFSYLKRDGFQGKLVILGGGSQEKRLKKISIGFGLSGNVDFVGAVPPDEVANYLRVSKIYLSMSLSDGASTSLFEALACGAFPIVSDIPANREWIVHGENGFLVPPMDSRALARCVMEAFNNSNIMENAAKKNFELIQNKAILQKNLEEMESIYHIMAKER